MKLSLEIPTIALLLAISGIIECRPQRKDIRGNDLIESQKPILARKDQDLGITNPDQAQPLKTNIGQNVVNLRSIRPQFPMKALGRRQRRSTASRDWNLVNRNPNLRASAQDCNHVDPEEQEYVKFEFPGGFELQVPAGCKNLNREAERTCEVEEIPNQPVEEGSSVFVTRRKCEEHEGMSKGLVQLPRGLAGSDHVCQQEFLFVKIQERDVKVESGCVPRLLDK